MMRFIRDLRLIPIAMIASACLLVLKMADFVLDGGSPATESAPPAEVTVIHAAPGVSRPSDCEPIMGATDVQLSGRRRDCRRPVPTWRSFPRIVPMPDDNNADIITGSVNEEKSEAKPKGEGAEPAGKEEKPGTPGKDNKPAAAAKDEPAPRRRTAR